MKLTRQGLYQDHTKKLKQTPQNWIEQMQLPPAKRQLFLAKAIVKKMLVQALDYPVRSKRQL